MKVKEVSERLLEGVAENITEHGFRFNKSKKCFTRVTNDCQQIFDLLFYKKSDGIYVEPLVRLKVKPIEDIYHQVALKESQYFEATTTLGNNLFKIIDYLENGTEIEFDEEKKYLIESDSDIDILIKVISENFENYALPYFDRNSSVRRVDELLNAYPREISIHNWLYPDRACIAIIAAKLTNNPKFNELVNIYSDELEDAAEDCKEEFNKLKLLLKGIN